MSIEAKNLPRFDNPPAALRVRGLLCTDSEGRVQVVAPEEAIVDPEPIRCSTERNLRGLPPGLDESVCAIPGFYGLPSVVHAALKEAPELALATEAPGEYVRATGAEIRALCASHRSYEATFCEQLVPTPPDPADDEDNILAALDEFTARRIEARLDETLHIPPLPEAARRMIALQADPNYDLSDVVQIIETDPSMAARILGWANSARYGCTTPVTTLDDAIMRVLGFDMVFNMALGLAVGGTLNLPAHHVSGASPYWLDAVYAAATMEALAHQMPPASRPNPGLCYLIGLLSNFGTLVLGHVFPPQYETVCRLQETNPHLSHTHVDQHVLAVNREVLAATLLEQWDLPDELTTAVRYQHVSRYSGNHETYVTLLRLARTLFPCTDAPPPGVLAAAEELAVDTSGLTDVLSVLRASHDDLKDLSLAMAR